MKTFKLKSLEVLKRKNQPQTMNIPLIDGLIINREDDDHQWIIEAYTDHSYLNYFNSLKTKDEVINIQVIITKENNDPALFKTKIIGINEIDKKMNVLFKGILLDERKTKIEKMLSELIDKGLNGEALLNEFKKQMRG